MHEEHHDEHELRRRHHEQERHDDRRQEADIDDAHLQRGDRGEDERHPDVGRHRGVAVVRLAGGAALGVGVDGVAVGAHGIK